MKAEMTRYTIDNNLQTTGDDMIFIHIFFKVDIMKEIEMPVMVSYDKLLDFIVQVDENAGKYLNNIRSSMHGYGPKHSKVFKVMDEEGFDIEPYINKYFESKDDTYFQQHVEWCERAQTPENIKIAKESVEKLDALVNDDYRNYNINFDKYRDALDKAIHETTLTYFPELFEMSKKHIAAYRHELVNTTLSFSSEIDKIVHSKFKEYWEKRYDENNKVE